MESGEISGLTWLDKVEKELIDLHKQQEIKVVLSGSNNYKMKMQGNRLEMEMVELRNSTDENYMLNKMANTDGTNVYVEYTLYKNYDKYFGYTLEGDSLEVIDVMEEEFAEFLYHYRLSTIYSQGEAVHEDTWDITPEENGTIKEQMESGETDKFTPVYDENDIDKQLVVDSKYDMSTDSFSESYLKGPEMWTETPTNTNPDYAKPWTETSTNTNPYSVEPWTSANIGGSGTISVESGAISVAPEAFYIDEKQLKGLSTTQHLKNIQDGYVLISDIENKSDEEKLEDSSNALKNTENKSGAELITKIISDIIKEIFTEGTCSINITLKQD